MQNYNKKFLEKLTIVLPSFERQDFLIRFINYWSNKLVKVIIMDGSKKSLDQKIIENLEKNIKYYHLPKSFYERMYKATVLVNTEFVIQACDDEFYIPSALNSSIIKLIDNPDLVTCGGYCMGFGYENRSVIGFKRYEMLENLKLLNSNPSERINKHFSNYVPAHLYSVSRTKIWRIASKTVYSKEYSFFGALELQLEFLLLFAGKTIILPELMWLRSNENEPIHDGTPSFAPKNTFKDWWVNKRFSSEKRDFILRMELACKEIDDINNSSNKPNIKKGFKNLVYFHKHGTIGLLWVFLDPLIKLFPSFKNGIRTLYNFIYYKKPIKNDLMIMANKYFENQTKVNFNELIIIKDAINDFHKKKQFN